MTEWKLLPDAVAERLALTLIHSLWQGAAIGVAVVFIAIFRNRGPTFRYGLHLLALLALVAWSVFTFHSAKPVASQIAETELASPGATREPTKEIGAAEPVSPAPPIGLANSAHDAIPAWDFLPSFLAAKQWLALGWLVGVGLLSARLLLGWTWLQKLKRTLEPVPEWLQDKACQYCKELRCQLPRIQASSRIKEAIALGLIRPLVVIPSAWITDLPPAMLEAVLAHELAHIRRWDLWVNLFQRVVETLWFFHPVVWWLSGQMRIQRELCCDRLAVTVTRDCLGYVETLEKVGRLVSQGNAPGLAVSWGGNRMSLLSRVQFLLGQNPGKRSIAPWFASALAILAAAGTLWLTSMAREPKKAVEGAAEQITGTVLDAENHPVAGVDIQVFTNARRTDKTFRTNDQGQFEVPKTWRSRDEDWHLLVVQAKDRLGWFDLYLNAPPKDGDLSFKIVLVPLTQEIRGEIRDPQKKPLAGIPMRVEYFSHDSNRSVSLTYSDLEGLIPATITDKAGKFVMKVPEGTMGEVRPRALDWISARIRWKKGQGDLDHVQVEPGGRIEGRVVNARSRQPIGKARVGAQASPDALTGGWGHSESDDQGRFVIGGLNPGQFNVLFLQVPGNEKLAAPAIEAVTVQPGKAAQVEFRADEGRRLQGKVLDAETGKPVAKCSVGYYGSARPRSGAACMMVKTDSEGNFTFHVPPGVSFVYMAEGNREIHSNSTSTLEVLADKDPAPVLLQVGPIQKESDRCVSVCIPAEQVKKEREDPAYRLEGVLRASDGRPVRKVELRLPNKHARHTNEWMGSSGSSFTHRFPKHQDGRKAFFLVDAEGFAPTRSQEFVIAAKMPVLTIDLQPEVLVLIKGRVVDPQGKPIAGARIRTGKTIYLREEEYPWGLEAVTDQDGFFQLKHLRVGDRFYVRADKSGFGGAESARILLDKPEPITLPNLSMGPPNQILGGQVIDQDAEPVAGAKVIYRADVVVEAATDAQGRFRMEGLPVGKVPLTITAEGFRQSSPKVQTGNSEARLFLPRLPQPENQEFRWQLDLKPKDGKTVKNTKLWVVDLEGNQWLSSTSFAGNHYEMNVAQYFRRMKGKTLAAVVAGDGYVQSKPELFTGGKNPKPTTIELEPAAAIKLRGRVMDAAGKPVAGAKLGLSLELAPKVVAEPWRYLGSRELAPSTDAEGGFQIDGVQPGSRLAVYVNAPGYAGAWSPRAVLEKDKDHTFADLILKKATSKVSGQVLNSKGQPVPGARVYFHDFGEAETVTDAQGSFQLTGPDGENVLCVDAPEYGVQNQMVKADVKNLTFKLAPE